MDRLDCLARFLLLIHARSKQSLSERIEAGEARVVIRIVSTEQSHGVRQAEAMKHNVVAAAKVFFVGDDEFDTIAAWVANHVQCVMHAREF